MVYESSYETGRLPFQPDATRGHWASPGDFIFATIGLAFRLDILTLAWFAQLRLSATSFIPYLISLGLYVVPIMVILAFMGQFSSSGFMSALRLSPIFKDIGFLSIVVNTSILTYYSLFAAIPLLFLFNSLHPTLPWSCDGVKHWIEPDDSSDEYHHICNITHDMNFSAISLEYNDNRTNYDYRHYQVPSSLFLGAKYNGNISGLLGSEDIFLVSWQMLLCTMLTWAIIAGCFWKCTQAQTFGKILRYAISLTIALLLICLARFCFLPGTPNRLEIYFELDHQDIILSPMYTLSAFGCGWGAVIALSSNNKFKTNIMRHSWYIIAGQTVIWFALGGIEFLMDDFFHFILLNEDGERNPTFFVSERLTIFTGAASVISTMELAHLWTILYYTMLTLAALVTMITQLFSILTSLFDEFEGLRAHKSKVTFSLIGFLAFCSLFSCTNHGLYNFSPFAMDTVFTQTVLNLLLLLMVLWIYGRVRFQRDIEFMLGQPFTTWKVNMLRFASPLCLILALLLTMIAAMHEHIMSSITYHYIALGFLILPFLFIPGYMIYVLLQSTGSLKMRFQRCSRPNDWYPVDKEDRQRYEEAMCNQDITHQLEEVEEQTEIS